MKSILGNKRAQVAVEYVLILFISVSCAVILVNKLINREESSPGKIIDSWNRVLKVIGYDLPDCSNQRKFDKAQCN